MSLKNIKNLCLNKNYLEIYIKIFKFKNLFRVFNYFFFLKCGCGDGDGEWCESEPIVQRIV